MRHPCPNSQRCLEALSARVSKHRIHETRAGVMAKGHQQSMVTQRVACLKAQAAW